MSSFGEWIQVLLDHVASGHSGARDFLTDVSAAGLSSGLSAATVQQALTAGETQTLNQARARRAYDYIVSAKIGADADAVVDSKLRVHGLRGLRVADASVMPSIISGPGTNAASYMIGGRAAELIKADV
jgi:choline dehydrogenase